jgi:hypothetical protein
MPFALRTGNESANHIRPDLLTPQRTFPRFSLSLSLSLFVADLDIPNSCPTSRHSVQIAPDSKPNHSSSYHHRHFFTILSLVCLALIRFQLQINLKSGQSKHRQKSNCSPKSLRHFYDGDCVIDEMILTFKHFKSIT